MFRLKVYWLVLLVVKSFTPASSETKAAAKNESGKQATSTWVIVVDDPRSERRKRGAVKNYAGKKDYRKDPLLQRFSQNLTKKYALELAGHWPIESIGVHCIIIQNTSYEQLFESGVQGAHGVRWLQPLNQFETLSSTNQESAKQGSQYASEQDPYRRLQPALTQLQIDKLDPKLSGKGVTIAIVDSGIQQNHPEFAGADLHYQDFVVTPAELNANSKAEKHPAESHGTGIAGVIIAQPENGLGIAGIAPKASLHLLRACWESKSSKARCNSLTLSLALDRVVSLSPDLLNLSLTGPKDPLLDVLIKRIIAGGTLVVTALDRRRDADERFPQPQTGVLYACSSIAEEYSGQPCLLLPGKEILVPQPTDTFDFMSGDSLATVHLTGLLGLLAQTDQGEELVELSRQHTAFNMNGKTFNLCALLRDLAAEPGCPSL